MKKAVLITSKHLFFPVGSTVASQHEGRGFESIIWLGPLCSHVLPVSGWVLSQVVETKLVNLNRVCVCVCFFQADLEQQEAG